MAIRWAQAMRMGKELFQRCCGHHPLNRNLTTQQQQLWALPLYVLADTGKEDVADLAGPLRYRLQDATTYTTWLCSRLQARGHQVTNPVDDADADANFARPRLQKMARRLEFLNTGRHDDDIVNIWLESQCQELDSEFYTIDGLKGSIPGMKPLDDCRTRMLPAIDDLLLFERGGWQARSLVRIHDIPFAYTGTATAAELGVHTDRAVIRRPRWTFDDLTHTVAPGLPPAYIVCYRRRDTGREALGAEGVVPAEYLTLDTQPARPTSQTPAPVATRPAVQDMPADAVTLPADTERITTAAQESEAYRAAALARLWDMHDREITNPGHTQDAYVARRIASELGYPAPAARPTLRQLDDEAAREHQRRQTPHELEVASWCPPDRHLVNGAHRAELLRWLYLITDAPTTAQRATLDNPASLQGHSPHAPHSVYKIRQMLADEGFVEVLDVHGNAGHAPQPRKGYTPAPPEPPTPDGDVEVWMFHEADGFLAVAAARGPDPASTQLHIHFNAMVLDREIFHTAVQGTGVYVRDSNGQHTTVTARRLEWVLYRRSAAISVRLQLAAIRAFTTPITPWMDTFSVRSPLTGTDEAIDWLPAPVRERLGPALARTTRTTPD